MSRLILISLWVTATTGVEEAVVFWKVYVPARPTICSVNLINFGLVVNGTCTTVEFQGVGPTAGFLCRLNNGQFESCECVVCSLQASNVSPLATSSICFLVLILDCAGFNLFPLKISELTLLSDFVFLCYSTSPLTK